VQPDNQVVINKLNYGIIHITLHYNQSNNKSYYAVPPISALSNNYKTHKVKSKISFKVINN